MLPDIADHIIELPSLKIVHRAGRKPVFHINISYFPMLPIELVLVQQGS